MNTLTVYCVSVGLLFTSLVANAGVSLNKTRLVFNAQDKSAQLVLHNSSNDIYLMQSLILASSAQAISHDFIAIPPLFRLEGKADNVLKISRVAGNLPTDKESLRYILIRAIPSANKPVEKKSTALSIAIGTQIKLFYRPQHLPIKVEKSYGLLTAQQQGNQLIIHNPTPYYQTFAQVLVDNQTIDFRKQPQMVAPFSDIRLTVAGHVKQWQWRCINDYGGESQLFSQSMK